MNGFAGFLRRDLDAVTAGLTVAWSSGVVDGHGQQLRAGLTPSPILNPPPSGYLTSRHSAHHGSRHGPT